MLLGNPSTDDPRAMTQAFYNTLPVELLGKYELGKNNKSFDKVIKYNLTNEILSTNVNELNKFDF